MAGSSTYDRALRAIAQDLSDVKPESIEITIEGDAFVVRGKTAHAPASKEEGALKKTWHRLVSRESQPKPPAASHITFTRRYGQFDIDRLDKKGRTHRVDSQKTPDIHTLPEILRAAGRIANEKRGTLVRISTDRRKLQVQFRDHRGNMQAEEHILYALYKMQQDFYAQRAAQKGKDVWEGQES
ncbi:MAG: hypothetical protein ACREQW_14980 [Candidatus Binatia bacterium]